VFPDPDPKPAGTKNYGIARLNSNEFDKLETNFDSIEFIYAGKFPKKINPNLNVLVDFTRLLLHSWEPAALLTPLEGGHPVPGDRKAAILDLKSSRAVKRPKLGGRL
jgi:hypothetical protein